MDATSDHRVGLPPDGNSDPELQFETLLDEQGQRLQPAHFGDRRPTVLLDAGFAGGGHVWSAVVPELVGQSRVIIVDRSDFRSWPVTGRSYDAAAIASSMANALARSSNPGPVIAVGETTGAMYVRLLDQSGTFPVAGHVLIDPIPWNVWQLLEESVKSNRAIESTYLEQVLGEIEMVRSILGDDPLRLAFPPLAIRTPQTFIARGTRPGDDDRFAQQWNALQADELRQASNAHLVIAGRGGSSIPGQRPEVVASAILRHVHRISTAT